MLAASFPADLRDGRVCWVDGRAYILRERDVVSAMTRAMSGSRVSRGSVRRTPGIRNLKAYVSTQRSLERLELQTHSDELKRYAAQGEHDASLRTHLAGFTTKNMLSNSSLVGRFEQECVRAVARACVCVCACMM